MNRLKDKIAVITGGNSGIGFATAKEFIANGAKVIITGRNQELVNKAVTDLGPNATGILADTANIGHTQALAEKVKAQFGKIDILYVNAGVAKFAPVGETPESLFDETMDINFKGAFFTAQHLLPLVNDGGSIIFTSSVVTQLAMAGSSVYTASKAALTAFAKILANELSPRKIRVNIVSPGPIETPIMQKFGWEQEAIDEMKDGLSGKTLAGRMGRPEEIAKTVTFLASDDASFVNGADYFVDGGGALNRMN